MKRNSEKLMGEMDNERIERMREIDGFLMRRKR